MPQMKPINWLFSLFLFSLTLFLFMMMNYFNFINKPLNINNKMNMTSKKSNWKW